MESCQTRSEFLIRSIRLGIDPDQLVSICRPHARGLGFGDWDRLPGDDQDEVLSDLLDRIEMLHRAGMELISASRLAELQQIERTMRRLGDRAIEQMHYRY